jgi:hypothetical protein
MTDVEFWHETSLARLLALMTITEGKPDDEQDLAEITAAGL